MISKKYLSAVLKSCVREIILKDYIGCRIDFLCYRTNVLSPVLSYYGIIRARDDVAPVLFLFLFLMVVFAPKPSIMVFWLCSQVSAPVLVSYIL